MVRGVHIRLSVSVSVFVCLSVCLPACLPVCVRLYVRIYVCMYVCIEMKLWEMTRCIVVHTLTVLPGVAAKVITIGIYACWYLHRLLYGSHVHPYDCVCISKTKTGL